MAINVCMYVVYVVGAVWGGINLFFGGLRGGGQRRWPEKLLCSSEKCDKTNIPPGSPATYTTYTTYIKGFWGVWSGKKRAFLDGLECMYVCYVLTIRERRFFLSWLIGVELSTWCTLDWVEIPNVHNIHRLLEQSELGERQGASVAPLRWR